MRITSLVIIASVAALAFTAPAYAKNSETQKSDDRQASPSPSCRAYQKAADGSWQELAARGGVETRSRIASLSMFIDRVFRVVIFEGIPEGMRLAAVDVPRRAPAI